MTQVTTEKHSFAFIILSIFLGNFLAFLNSGTVNVALPSIMNDLEANIHTAQWVVTGFMFSIGTIAPVVGYLGNKFGFKTLYVIALTGFTVFSALCGLAWNIGSLILFRILQGICSGLIQISTMTMIYQSVEKEKQAMAISLWTVSIMVAPAIGPTVGGVITDFFGWKTLFFANVPIGAIAIICAYFFLPSRKEPKTVTLDQVGLTTVVIGNVSLLLYFSIGTEIGLLSAPALVLLLMGIAGVAAFIWRALAVQGPLLNIRVFQYPTYALGTAINCLLFIGLYSTVFLFPFLMEEAYGVSSFVVGLMILPGALLMIFVSILTGKLHGRLNPAWLVLAGACLLIMATWEFSQLRGNSTVASITFWLVVRYVGIGLAASPVTNIAMSVIPAEQVGDASSISNWLRQVVSAFAIAIFSSILGARTQTHLDDLGADMSGEALKQSAFLLATNDTFLVATVFLIISVPLSLILLKRTSKDAMDSVKQGANG